MKLFKDLSISETFVVEGGFVLVKTEVQPNGDNSIFPDAVNVTVVFQPEHETYSEAEFEEKYPRSERESECTVFGD